MRLHIAKTCLIWVCVLYLVLFLGKDGSRAFVSGDFSASGLTDDVSGLTNNQWLDLLHWFQFYDKQYIYVGMICILYVNNTHDPRLFSIIRVIGKYCKTRNVQMCFLS